MDKKQISFILGQLQASIHAECERVGDVYVLDIGKPLTKVMKHMENILNNLPTFQEGDDEVHKKA
mgnify:CR=1 FL=1